MKKWSCLAMLVLLATLPSLALADSTPTPRPGWTGNYKVVSDDGRYVLVMLGSYSCPCGEADEATRELNALAQQYKISGLYRNDGSTAPLWTIGYIDWRHGITLSSDGHHLVEWGGWPRLASYGAVALTFYEDGAPVRSYSVRDLVADPGALPRSASHYSWRQGVTLDDATGQLRVTTLHGEQYLFDMGTGHILSAVVPTRGPITARPAIAARPATTAVTVADTTKPGESTATPMIGLLFGGLGLSAAFSIAGALRSRGTGKHR